MQGLVICVKSELISGTTMSHGWVLLRKEGRTLFAQCLIAAEQATGPHSKQHAAESVLSCLEAGFYGAWMGHEAIWLLRGLRVFLLEDSHPGRAGSPTKQWP